MAITLKRDHSRKDTKRHKGNAVAEEPPPPKPDRVKTSDISPSSSGESVPKMPRLPPNRAPEPPPTDKRPHVPHPERPPLPPPGRPGVHSPLSRAQMTASPERPLPPPPKPEELAPPPPRDTSSSIKDRPALPPPANASGKKGIFRGTKKQKDKIDRKESKPIIENNSNTETQVHPRSSSFGSKISLSDLNRGLTSLKSTKGSRKDDAGKSQSVEDVRDVTLPKRPLTATRSDVEERVPQTAPGSDSDQVLSGDEAQRPVPAPRRPGRKTVKEQPKPNGSLPTVPEPSTLPRKPVLPPKKVISSPSSSSGENDEHPNETTTKRATKPSVPPGKPALRPNKPYAVHTPSVPKTNKPKGNAGFNINKASVKPGLRPIVDEIENLYQRICEIIDMTDARLIEGVKDKSDNCADIANTSLENLSEYRDSLGPVARMKVNPHLNTLESSLNDFVSFKDKFPAIPTATDLGKLGKILSSFRDGLDKLISSFPSL